MALANATFSRNSFANDGDRVFPDFFMAEVQDELASASAGRPIYKQVERVKIVIPGNMLSQPVENVTDVHRERWPRQYDAFKKGQEIAHDGTPLEMWPILNKAQVKELKASEVYTIEQMANVSDTAIQRLGMGAYQLRALAKAYLDDAERESLTASLSAAVTKKDAEIAELNLKVEQMATTLNQVHAELMSLRNAPRAIDSAIPGVGDPVERARQAQPAQPIGDSSLAAFAAPKRRGRQAKEAAA